MPRTIAGTLWTGVEETCRRDLGIEFDGWQDGCGQLALSIDSNAVLSHTVGGFHLAAMRQVGKAVSLSNDLLTANRGWTTFADVRVGDLVFHPSGRSVTVTYVSQVELGRRCYKVTTTDGRQLVTDAEHLWTVKDARRGRRWREVTTEQMLHEGIDKCSSGSRAVATDGKSYRTREYRFQLPRQFSIAELPAQSLPLDPYLFGAWLGNGTTNSDQLTFGNEDIEHWINQVSALGHRVKVDHKIGKLGEGWSLCVLDQDDRPRRLRTFYSTLVDMEQIGNKHVPICYLIGSTEQRLALLQGLLDTDGHITGQHGTVEFCSILKDLADSVLLLARSLGWRATLNAGRATLNGEDCGVKYRVTFTPKASDPHVPFRIPRKIARIGQSDGGKGRFTVSIESITPVETRPVRCIRVNSPDGLFLAGRDLVATHNTYFVAGLKFGLCQTYPGLLCLWTAHHTATSDETFESMQEFASRRLVKPHIDFVHTGSNNQEVRFLNGSRIVFGARDRGFGRGIPGVDVMFFDESQILSKKAVEAMVATMNTSWLGLHMYAGTPPDEDIIKSGKADRWLRARDEAWVIDDPDQVVTETDDLVWIEFGGDPNADSDDVTQWGRNPSFPHRTNIQAMLRLRRNLDDEGWAREGLGIYRGKDPSIFDLTRWDTELAVNDADEPSRGVIVLDVSPDRQWSALGFAGEFCIDGEPDPDDRDLVMVMSFRGTADAVAKLVELEADNDVSIFITPGAAKAVQRNLNKAQLEYETLTSSEVASAYGTLQLAIRDGSVVHLSQSELRYALEHTKSRYINVGETESFDRREKPDSPKVDVSPAVSVACALDRWSETEGMPYIG